MSTPALATQDGHGTAATAPYAKRRLHHIFAPDGRAVVVAMDHARESGVATGLEQPAEAVRRVVAGGVDAIMTTPGMARVVAGELGGKGLIVALDSEGPVASYGVELALRLGADAVELKVFPGSTSETRFADLRQLVARCAEWNMPLLAEPIPVSFEEKSAHTVENISRATRMAAEAGADFVKAHYVGPIDAYAVQVIGQCFAPVIILGGPAHANPRDALQHVADALAAGARGVAFGRNIIQHPRPDRMAGALVELIHGGSTVDSAARHIAAPY